MLLLVEKFAKQTEKCLLELYIQILFEVWTRRIIILTQTLWHQNYKVWLEKEAIETSTKS